MPKLARPLPANSKLAIVAAALGFSLLPAVCSAQISLSTAVDLAEKSSPTVRSAIANVQRATASLAESKDVFYPNLMLGSSVGPPPYGFPLGNPDIYDINMQSMVYSFSQPDYIRAAHSGLYAATMNLRDQKQQVALDVSVAYVELNHDLEEIAALNDQQGYAEKLASMEEERVGNGVDPRVSELQAQLIAAQIAEKLLHLQNDADEMRQKLSHLTGLPLESLQTVASSIPPPPSFSQNSPTNQQLADANGAIAAAFANAQSKDYVAHGDKRQIRRPSIGFGLKYQRFAKYENFAEYYHNFQQNNVSAGVELSIPLFDRSLKAKARESAAVAAEARAEAESSLDTLSEQDLAARRSIQELAAEQRVAQIQSELAQEQLQAIDTELTSGPGSPNAQPVSPITAQKAHIEERERFEELLDTKFSLMKVELNLLRMTSQIDDWARSSLH